jgi:serine phosphatase RsbU (regulator of sigma subunit)
LLHTAKEINDRIIEAVGNFTGDGAQRDDFTLVTVKRS